MKKIRFIICVLIIALTVGMTAPGVLAVDDPQIDTTYAAVLLGVDDNGNRTVLYMKNENERVYPASLTKIMTVLLAVEDIEAGKISLTDQITSQSGYDYDLVSGGSSAYIMLHETMTLESLLYCAMVASANDACNVIAQYVGGTIPDFIDRMNTRAQELGCTNTHFANTHGLTDENHYTTPRDFSRIVCEAASHELFMTIANTVNYTVPDTNVSVARELESTNSLINPTNTLYPGDWGYEYAKGIKTGHTESAGYCLASSAEKDGVRLVSVVFNCDSYEQEDGTIYYGNFADTRTLFEWGFTNFGYQDIVKSTEIVAEVPVEMGANAETVTARPSAAISALLPNDADVSTYERTVTLTLGLTETGLTAPVSAGQVVGEITVSKDGVTYGSATLVTTTSVDLSRTQYMKEELLETLRSPGFLLGFFVLVALFALYLVIVVRYRAKRRAYQKRLAMARTIRIDMEDDEEELRQERRERAAKRRRNDVMLTPDTVQEPEEPTRVSGEIPAAEPSETEEEDPTRVAEPIGDEEEKPKRAYIDEFFDKK